ncbi:YbaB/EbfC family nucleoid-associated protein [Krasilnikovia sp. MM14-A1004]|uniref:YbaB/EbfC family nucleoid-associated protein n=1 Tax=Krasilnikovia sp. MM14-A1004 TaxID=3373541 RepID=UPI00399C72A7
MRDIDAAEDWLDSWTAGVSAQAERAAALSRRVAALTGTATSADGSVKITVGASGQVEKFELDDRVQRLPGAELARQLTAVMRAAQAKVAAQVAVEVQETVGADSETGRAVIQSYEARFPQPDDEAGNGAADER